MIHTLLPIESASSICYVDINIHLLEFLDEAIFLIRSQIFSLDLRSKLDVGSSSIINFASPINAIAIESFLLAPGDRNLTYLSSSLKISTSYALLLIVFYIDSVSEIPLSLQISFKCSSTVSSSKRKSFC